MKLTEEQYETEIERWKNDKERGALCDLSTCSYSELKQEDSTP